ncbi:hypothetical protein F4825DRAFT_207502 [Nemania diffusa]|nr:hypothetical protein F4825DRAFT_207502 [Nemania diffusa]
MPQSIVEVIPDVPVHHPMSSGQRTGTPTTSENSVNESSSPLNPPGDIAQGKARQHSDSRQDTTPRLPLQSSLSTLGCVTIFGGSFLTLAALAFLLFLWGGRGPVEGGAKAQPVWRAIMLHGWATQAVTLTSLVLRIISASQAGLCTSMVAALLLERRSVPVSQVAQLSVTRSVNGGPLGLLYTMTSRRMRLVVVKPEVLLLFILALTTFALQFSSTILISDFGMMRLIQDANHTTLNVALSPEAASTIGSFLTFGNIDSSTVLFGDVDSPDDPAPNLQGVSDTGPKRRAFLPFQKEDRVNLQHFSGAAFSSVSRTACIRPSMSAELNFNPSRGFSISGRIAYNQSLQDAGQAPTQQCSDDGNFCLPLAYNCSLPVNTDPSLFSQWPTAICHLLINADETSHIMPSWDQHSGAFDFAAGFWPALVFATNMPASYMEQLIDSGPITLGKPLLYGEWASYELEPGKFLNTTFCSSTLNATVSSLSMTGELNQTEPELAWNTTTRSYEVSSLQTLFGADNVHKTPAQRGILSITSNIQDPVSPNDLDVNRTSALGALEASSATFGNGAAAGVWANSVNGSSVGMCDHCDIFGGGVSDDIAALFQHIVNTTGRAAVAVDTYLAMLSRSWFYSLLQKFDVPGTVITAFATTVLLPIRWSGLAAVLSLVATNTVLTWIITVLYVLRTRFTFAGNYWHAVSQLIYKDTLPLLEKGGEMKDEDVAEELDMELEDFLVKIDRLEIGGRVSVVKV